jgi:hypothetical protein
LTTRSLLELSSSVEASTLEELLCILLESRSDALREIVRSVCTWPRGHDFTDAVVGELSHTARAELVLARSRTMLIDHQEDLTSPVLDDALASGRAASAMVAYELAENPSEVDWTSTAAERALQEVRRAVSPPSSSGIGAQYQTVTTEPPANDAPTAIATLAKSLDGKLRLEPPASPTLGVPPRPEPSASPTLGVPPRMGLRRDGVGSVTWTIGERLGAIAADCSGRWTWFAAGDDEWRDGFEQWLRYDHMAESALAADLLHLTEDGRAAVSEVVHDLLWGRGGSLAELRARARGHRQAGEALCRIKYVAIRCAKLDSTTPFTLSLAMLDSTTPFTLSLSPYPLNSDEHCQLGTRYWVMDITLDAILKQIDLQHVDLALWEERPLGAPRGETLPGPASAPSISGAARGGHRRARPFPGDAQPSVKALALEHAYLASLGTLSPPHLNR